MFKFFKFFVNFIGWLQLVASSFFLSGGVGFMLYYLSPTDLNYILAILISFVGLIIGIIWATKIWKSKEGVISYLAQADATPEMDEFLKKQSENK